ncbi:response regulator transcription factor [Parageobacillus thermoglucosidasius]|uniref:response regulator transcription factor n=1 Tax=Parageobacillus thermoglucosidasius TaxID=1426 RepID=UPI000E14FC8E|nr:response regulator transcription factor [Parageobacillus thermoglucosidasius]MED4906236.1 response regulator transcription factor [Parageobacillus thermoglucosidasius]MED4915483.1 response regulator transcription factor [Parageobacillus thermoglucosidasius]MED4945841.1 response regulator transcription factor [Parageobacillus thermoglucosidasius]MED4984320.1 response regulator transcription factor [Parageobacillus thermoglucosidasius]RDE28633.1 DNA-binding response regulator [Parageobacillus
METVLLVDDEEEIIELMKDFLEAEGYNVLTASNGLEALSILKKQVVHCVLLDIMMPNQSGFTTCKKIREISDVPILFLTAVQDDTDKIRGLNIGADDYIVKSATPGEIVARIKAVLRRSRSRENNNTLNYGNLKINIYTREVFVNGRRVNLTPKEFELLQFLAEHPRQVFSHDQLYQKVWGNELIDEHTIRVFIARLREKIEENPSKPQWIHTVWGVGYKFENKK